MRSRFYSSSGDVEIAGGKWGKRPFLIMQTEARAVRLALSAFYRHLAIHHGRLGGQHSVSREENKGSLKSHTMTWELQRTYEFVDSRGIQASFAYGRSVGNPQTACRAVVCLHFRTWRRGGTCEGERRCLVAGGPQSLPLVR
ncbi:target of rapamycin (TOR) kinase 1 [Trypanosoma cruzi]|nr:target of rapamycin (TOR) kinase 1 [Trypanosoma cruzi]